MSDYPDYPIGSKVEIKQKTLSTQFATSPLWSTEHDKCLGKTLVIEQKSARGNYKANDLWFHPNSFIDDETSI